MALEHGLGGGFQFGGLMVEVGAGAALGFAGVAGQLDAVDGEHLAPDQALPVADVEDLAEDAGDVVAERRDKSGEGGEMRLAVTGQGDEGDVFAAGALDVAAADDALGIAEQDDLEQHGGRIGAGAGGVIAEAGIAAAEVDFVVEQVVQRMFESAGDELPLQVNGEKPRASVNVLVARHGASPEQRQRHKLDAIMGLRQDTKMILFLQPR